MVLVSYEGQQRELAACTKGGSIGRAAMANSRQEPTHQRGDSHTAGPLSPLAQTRRSLWLQGAFFSASPALIVDLFGPVHQILRGRLALDQGGKQDGQTAALVQLFLQGHLVRYAWLACRKTVTEERHTLVVVATGHGAGVTAVEARAVVVLGVALDAQLERAVALR